MIRKCFIVLFLLYSTLSSTNKNNEQQAEYLIIYPDLQGFKESLIPLVELRENNGYSVNAVNVKEIYNCYPELKPQSAIREYISYALETWTEQKPKYVLIAGDTELIPSYRVKSMFSIDPKYKEDSVAVDDWFVTSSFEKDELPDAAIGRLPVINYLQLQKVIAKIINFERDLYRESYSKDLFVISDKTDSYFFELESEKLSKKCIEAGYRPKRIDFDEESNYAGTKTDVINELCDGAIFNNYNGHGAPKQWSKYSIFTIEDFDSLFHSTKPGIFTSLACSQNFDIKNDSSIVEKLILYPKGGAVATIAPSGIGMSNDGSRFISKFYDLMLKDDNMTVGEAMNMVKRETLTLLLPDDAICRRFTLLGDPALTLPKRNINQVEANQGPETLLLLQNYPNPFNPSTVISYQLSVISKVELKVYDVLGSEVAVLVNSEQNAGSYKVEFSAGSTGDGSNFSSGVYFYTLKAGDFIQTKKMTLLK